MLRFGRQPRAMRPALLGTQVSTSEVSGIVTVTSFPSSDLQSTQRSLQLCSVESQHQAWHRPGCAMQGAARGPRRGTYHVCANFVYWDSDMVMIRAWEACFPSPAVPAHIASDVWVNFVILQRVNLHVRRLVGGSWSAFLPTPLMVSARYSSSSVWFITPLLSLTILVPVLPPLAASRIAGIRSASSHLPEGAWHCSSTQHSRMGCCAFAAAVSALLQVQTPMRRWRTLKVQSPVQPARINQWLIRRNSTRRKAFHGWIYRSSRAKILGVGALRPGHPGAGCMGSRDWGGSLRRERHNASASRLAVHPHRAVVGEWRQDQVLPVLCMDVLGCRAPPLAPPH